MFFNRHFVRRRLFLYSSFLVVILSILSFSYLKYIRAPKQSLSNRSSASPSSIISDTDYNKYLAPYPPGRWRLAPWELKNVVVSLSHILVSHKKSNFNSFLRSYFDIFPDTPNNRTKSNALHLALKIAKKAFDNSHNFPQLAKSFSDDILTSDNGGSLGTVSADHLSKPFLNAISSLKPGQVSRIIETNMGFHILNLRPSPPEVVVSTSHIVIGYKGTNKNRIRSGRLITRTRQEAKHIAYDISAQLKVKPELFDDYVFQYSDHEDASRSGDMGNWSNYRPKSDMNRPIEKLISMKAGEISEPIETGFGFQLFRKETVIERKKYAMKAIQVWYNNHSKESSSKRSEAFDTVTRYLSSIRKDKNSFDDILKNVCCPNVQQWTEGRARIGLAKFLNRLSFNDISDEPLELGNTFYIVKRLDPDIFTKPEEPVTTVLPSPTSPDIAQIVRNVQSRYLSKSIKDLNSYIQPLLYLSGSTGDRFGDILSRISLSFERDDPDSRVAVLDKSLADLRSLLGPHLYNKMMYYVNEYITIKMMDS